MDKFITHIGTAIPLRRSNVDTDQIIPAVYLKRVTKSGFEDGLFAAWRNDPEFVLNNASYAGATILVAGADFGTGSSREHAVWALQNYGFKVVISEADVESMWSAIESDSTTEITVDLEKKVISFSGKTLTFELDDYVRWRLMEGLDDIGLTLQKMDEVAEYEAKRAAFKPKTLPILS